MKHAPFTFHTVSPRTATQRSAATTLRDNTTFPVPAVFLFPDSKLLVGVSFDDDACSEHEGGINPLKKALGIQVPYHQRHTATSPNDVSLCTGPALNNIHLARIDTSHYGHVLILCAGQQPVCLSETSPPSFLTRYANVDKATAYWDSEMFAIAMPLGSAPCLKSGVNRLRGTISHPDTPLLFQLYALLLQGSCHLFSTSRILPTSPDNWGLFSPTLADSVWTGRIRNASNSLARSITEAVALKT